MIKTSCYIEASKNKMFMMNKLIWRTFTSSFSIYSSKFLEALTSTEFLISHQVHRMNSTEKESVDYSRYHVYTTNTQTRAVRAPRLSLSLFLLHHHHHHQHNRKCVCMRVRLEP